MTFDGALKTIQLNKTVIESDLLLWSEHLQNTLNNGTYEEFCHRKSELTPDDDLQMVWKFLKTMFQSNSKEAQLEILGYSTDKINKIASQFYNNRNGVENSPNGDEVNENKYICLQLCSNLLKIIFFR